MILSDTMVTKQSEDLTKTNRNPVGYITENMHSGCPLRRLKIVTLQQTFGDAGNENLGSAFEGTAKSKPHAE